MKPPPQPVAVALCAVVRPSPTEGGSHELLVVARSGNPTSLAMPGGKAKPGEKMWQAALRELREETGLVARFEDLRWVSSGISDDGVRCELFCVLQWTGTPKEGDAGPLEWTVPGRFLSHTRFRGYYARAVADLRRRGVFGPTA